MLSDLLNSLNIQVAPDLSLLPLTDTYLQLGSISLPLYGSLLGGEELMREQINRSTAPYIQRLRDLYSQLGNPNSSLAELISQLQVGKVLINEWETVEIDHDLLGYPQLKEIADKAGITTEFVSTSLIIDGAVDNSLLSLVIEYFPIWVNNGIPMTDSISMANHVLQKKPVKKIVSQTVVDVNADEILASVKLTWGDLFLLKDVSEDQLPALLLIYFRTGIKHFNPFDYMMKSDIEAALRVVEKEMNPEKEEVIANQNVQISTSGGGETAPLDSESSTTTSPSTKS